MNLLSRRNTLRGDSGFTLVEVLVALVLATILSTIAMLSLRTYSKVTGHRGAVREVVAKLRNAQVRAVAEAATYQCRFTTTTLKFYRDSADPPLESNRVGAPYTLNSRLRFVNVNFTHNNPAIPITACFFYARGSADPGGLTIQRVDNAKELDLTVEGLTARVSYDST